MSLDIDLIREIEVTLKTGETVVYKGNGLIKFKRDFIDANAADNKGIITKTTSMGGRYHTTDLSYEVSSGNIYDAAERMKKQSGLKH